MPLFSSSVASLSRRSLILACLVGSLLPLQRLGATEEVEFQRLRSSGAEALLERLQQIQQRGIMFGHQDSYLYGHDWKYEGVPDVKQVVGDYPAVFGWELGDLELGEEESLDGVRFDKIRKGIIWTHGQGAINTISWHANNPLTGGNSWDVSAKEVVKSILPGGEKHDDYRAMLDRLAVFFLSLEDRDGTRIPVIFRPFHEHTGSWFWWGQDLVKAERYIALWRFTAGYLQAQGVDHLLYAYSSAGNILDAEHFLERYPGDDLIDIVGFDAYQRGAEGGELYAASVRKALDIVVPIGLEKGKLIALAETGVESLPDPVWWTETLWPIIEAYPLSYALVWRNAYDRLEHFYAPYPGQKSAEDFRAFEQLDRTLFLRDIRK